MNLSHSNKKCENYVYVNSSIQSFQKINIAMLKFVRLISVKKVQQFLW